MWERWDSDVAGQWPQERFNNIFDFWEWYGVTIEISVILPGRMSDVDVFQVSFQVHLKASKISNSQWKSASLETRSPFNCLQNLTSDILPGRISDVDVFQVSFQVHVMASKISNSQWKSASFEPRSPFNRLQNLTSDILPGRISDVVSDVDFGF